MKGLTALLFFLLAGTALFAQDEADTTEVVEEPLPDSVTYSFETTEYQDEYSDSVIINPKDTRAASDYMGEDHAVKKFDDKDWKAIVGEVTFEEKAEKPKPLKKAREPWFKMPAMDPVLARTLSFIVIFILLAIILYYVSRNASFAERIRKMKPGDVAAPVENIEEVDIDGLLKKALADGDLRGAIRVHYLMLLKKLNEVGLIAWKKDKTNRDYLSELYGRNDCYEDVQKLTLTYEVVWYGERSVSQDNFYRISADFESVNRRVANGKPEA